MSRKNNRSKRQKNRMHNLDYLSDNDVIIDYHPSKHNADSYTSSSPYQNQSPVKEVKPKNRPQDVFMSALGGVAGFRQQSSFQTWLLSIARNKAITHLRTKRHRADKLEHLVIQHQIASVADGQVDPPVLDMLRRCLEQLKEEHQDLVNEVYYKEQTAADVARQMGQARNTIRMRLMRIRQALAKCIQRQTAGTQGNRKQSG